MRRVASQGSRGSKSRVDHLLCVSDGVSLILAIYGNEKGRTASIRAKVHRDEPEVKKKTNT